jgi:hypothetical protein
MTWNGAMPAMRLAIGVMGETRRENPEAGEMGKCY